MSDDTKVVLVHYHEIGLKGHNRATFEKRLQRNLEALLHDRPIKSFTRISGRILIECDNDCDQVELDGIVDLARRVPGVARISAGYRTEREIERINGASIEALGNVGDFESFKVKARRAHTDFPIDSMQMNRIVGAALCDAFPEKIVRMNDPDVTVNVEVVQSSAYVYALSVRGVGGLPVGVSGRICCLLSTGIDSPVATWKMARRGATCIGVHFSGRPETSDASEYLVRDIAEILAQTGCINSLYTFPLGTYQRLISLDAPPSLRVILYRRLMMKVAKAVAEIEHAGALVTGESLGQVASQTLENIRCTDAAVDMPVFRPLIGTDKLEIIEQAQMLGTFELSTQDSPDCCTLFMPRSPETHAKLSDVIAAESMFPEDEWVEELMSNAERIDCRIGKSR